MNENQGSRADGEQPAECLQRHARENKLFMTEGERALWGVLRRWKAGHAFRRQQVVGEYIVDFLDAHDRLVVEPAGKYHFKGERPVADEIRTADLNRMGYTVVKFTDDEVLHKPDEVARRVGALLRHMAAPAATTQPAPATQPAKASAKTATSAKAMATTAAPVPWNRNAWAVDAGCSGNPGPMEYQCVDLLTGQRVFHFGPVYGTNNIGEFLAIVHALALMQQRGVTGKVVYSDSRNAILWVKKKQCKTKLARNARTAELFAIIARAEAWLASHPSTAPVVKWETGQWGEIPADFGRK